MPAPGANIARLRLALGGVAVTGCLLAMWFSVLFQPLIYGLVLALLAGWIGLWPYNASNLGVRILIACAGSIAVCLVLIVVGEIIAYVRRDGLEEFGPILFVPAFMMVMGLPILVLSALVAAVAPMAYAAFLPKTGDS